MDTQTRIRLVVGVLAALACAAANASLPWEAPSPLGGGPPPLSLDHVREGRDFVGIVRGRGERPAPVVIWIPNYEFVSEEARLNSSWVPIFIHDNGFAYAKIGFRQERDAGGAKFAAEVAEGIAEVVSNADKFGIDRSRIILVGHGWGGHFAALLATDPTYLESVGVPFDSVRGAIALDPPALDLEAEAGTASEYRKEQLERLVGPDSQDFRRFSPLRHAEAPNAPLFLQTVEGEQSSNDQARRLTQAVVEAGGRAEVVPVRRTRPTIMQTYAGHHQNPDRKALIAFLKDVAR